MAFPDKKGKQIYFF